MSRYSCRLASASLVAILWACPSSDDSTPTDTGVVTMPMDADPNPDATPEDAGVVEDTGVVADTGVVEDTGVIVDTGAIEDTGVVADTGVITDTGVDRTPPTIVRRVPAIDATNVYLGDQILIEMSEPLDATSVSNTTVQVSAASPVLYVVVMSADRRTIVVDITNAPDVPDRFTVRVDAVTDEAGNAFAGEEWSFDADLWATGAWLGGQSVSVGATGHTVTIDSNQVRVRDAGGRPLGAPLNVDGNATPSRAQLIMDDDNPVVLWQETNGNTTRIWVSRWDGTQFRVVGAMVASVSTFDPLATLAFNGEPIVAYLSAPAIVNVRRFSGVVWNAYGNAINVGESVTSLDASATSLAAVSAAGFRVYAYDGNDWSEQGQFQAANVTSVHVADGANATIIGWTDDDTVSTNAHVTSYANQGFEAVGQALDLTFDSDYTLSDLAVDAMDRPVVTVVGENRAYAARFDGVSWVFLGGALATDASASALAIDARGEPTVAVVDTAGVRVARFNGGSSLPFGLDPLPAHNCQLPVDTSTAFPQTLSASGCYADTANKILAPGLFPYTVASQLWTDGAAKNRYVALPPGQTLVRTADVGSAWSFPINTVIVKEFVVGGRTVETRFLVKRCEETQCTSPWEGYSYEWNQAGTDGDLLTNEFTSEEREVAVGMTTQTYLYPGREQCGQCHTSGAGRVLGLKTLQLNRNFDYGGVVDNQLRALANAGVFGAAGVLPARDERLPTANDVNQPLEARARAYVDANCSPCHRPDSTRPTMDLRFTTTLDNTNLCSRIAPGDSANSWLVRKISVRFPALPTPFPGTQMPPIATTLTDPRGIALMSAWIDSLGACP